MSDRVMRALLTVVAVVAVAAPCAHAQKIDRTLLRAIQRGDRVKVEKILSKHPERLTETFLGCVAGEDVEVAQKLLTRGASHMRPLASGESALMVAAGSGSLAMVELLLDSGAAIGYAQPAHYLSEVGEKGEDHVYTVVVVDQGHDALTSAIAKGRADVVELLLARGADPNRCFVLESASSGTETDLFKFADSNQALTFPMKDDMRARMEPTETPGVVRFTSSVLPKGAVLSAPLRLAREVGNARVVELLEAAGAEADPECDPGLAAAAEENQKYR